MEIPVCEINEYLLPHYVQASEEPLDETFESSICCDYSNKWIISLPCGHKYHGECLNEWIDNKCRSCGAKRLRDTSTCPMCREEVRIIPNYNFWFKLGTETCNLIKWNDFIRKILIHTKHVKRLDKIQKYMKVVVINNLDFLSRHSLDCIDYDFYNLENIKEPVIEEPKRSCIPFIKYKRILTLEEKVYIFKFKIRLGEYIEYLEYISNNIPKPQILTDWCKKIYIFKKSIYRFRKVCEKFEPKLKF